MAILPIPPPPQKSDTLSKDDLLFRWLGTVQKGITNSTAGVLSFNNRTGVISLSSSDVTTAMGYVAAGIDSPSFTGIPTAPTAGTGTATDQIATTAFVIANSSSGGGGAGVANSLSLIASALRV